MEPKAIKPKQSEVRSIAKISIAPMMDWTDRHCRYFHRMLAPSVELYTEMVSTGAIIHGDVKRFLRFDESEHPIALQLGGSKPADLAKAAKTGEEYGYDAVNINCGCPSDRVQSGHFGACLMNEPELVAEGIKAMQDAVSIPVTVKSRIGIDNSDDYDFLRRFVDIIVDKSECNSFIIHARKAWLKGLSPKENREIPPLRYGIVERLKADLPHLDIHINGGIKTIEDIGQFLDILSSPHVSEGNVYGNSLKENDAKPFLNGVMIGREAYQNPSFLRQIEEDIFQTQNLMPIDQILTNMVTYIEKQQELYDTPIKSITRHMTGLFQGQPGARKWRQILSTEAHQDDVKADFILSAYDRAFKQTE